MMSFIANAGAVPLGYVSAMIDSEDQCLACSSEQCCLLLQNQSVQWQQHLRNANVFPPLPDLVLSNTPPPSPLRRAASLPFFPSSGNISTCSTTTDGGSRCCRSESRRGTSNFGTKPPCEVSHSNSHGVLLRTQGRNSSYHEIWEREGDRYYDNAGAQRSWNAANYYSPDLYFHHHQDCLPCGRMLQDAVTEEEGAASASSEEGTLQERNVRSVGRDLRRIADRFQLEHGHEEKQRGGDAELGFSRSLYKVCVRVRSLPNLVETH
ncbi:uncharacterized protein LOC135221110 isoform X2 [Macrobrachium nipponense]|uniref:uncharacterized protein LOC135221110 isoform X2 n=1 Tax=Macrobrachium nipponense TaxID=159736 RepID=UPI0030C7E852